jgi:predicted CoA-binding protein
MATINDARIREILSGSPTVAVLGIHREPEKAAFYVPEYLHDEGYRIIGVNPEFAGQDLFGEKVRSTLAEIGEPIDLVDVFRRPEHLPGHLDDILAMKPHPRVVWFQLGIRNDDAAAKLEAAGITVVQSRCTLADHQRLGLGKPVAR